MPLATDIATHTIAGVGFGIYTSDEIRKLSVKRITQPSSLDRLLAPIDDGLYDPSMGPIDEHTPCQMCGLFQEYCPGHFGHIELPVKLYNPLFFLDLLKILRLMCHSCHKLRIHSALAYRYALVMQLAHDGDLDSALTELDELNRLESNLKSKSISLDLETPCKDISKISQFKLTRVLIEFRSELSKRFQLAFPSKCANCKAPKLKITRDGYSKICFHRNSKDVMDRLYQSGIRYRSATVLKKNPNATLTQLDETDPFTRWIFHRDQVANEDLQTNQRIVYPNEIEESLKLLWKNQFRVISAFWASFCTPSSSEFLGKRSFAETFFVNVVPVPPNRFRPVDRADNGSISENKLNMAFFDMINLSNRIVKSDDSSESLAETWIRLQNCYNDYVDNTKGAPPKMGIVKPPGVKQRLEKKEGLFRQRIMGKRVDYSARSVISPDPYISTTQIGIPLVFARVLDYPEPVTDYNVAKLAKMVENGPEIYPGANAIEHENGRITSLTGLSAERRRALSSTLLKPLVNSQGIFGVKRVRRHLLNGDLLIVNRQPTLHKPSMMVHEARVMHDGNTIRMHYANCNVYNADFDGDEINLHFLQNQMSRAEALTIALNENQYIVPKDGTPARGLIQDHIFGAILLTSRDSFLSRMEFQQLLYCSISSFSTQLISIPPPAILKPRPTWTGKQLIGAILDQLLIGKEKLNLVSKCAISEDIWGPGSQEGIVIIKHNQLLAGPLGKNQLGAKPHGLVHSIYELYGAHDASTLLTALGKLLSNWLQIAGFTCGIDDSLIKEKAETSRKELRAALQTSFGFEEAAKFINFPITSSNTNWHPEIVSELMGIYNDSEAYDRWEKHMIGVASSHTSQIISTCFSAGLVKPFPKNNLSMMTTSGAKGSRINFSQISCVLGQQELEGKRVPIMCTNRPLPGFLPYDPSLRAGGYIADRFLTGIRPLEYFFHCMAGREGLIDTAVKTSRSGYLQRCIVKHLENLVVQYDSTVRDVSDNSIVQFQYGEDGIDVVNSGYLEKFHFYADNLPALMSSLKYHDAVKQLHVLDDKCCSEIKKKNKRYLSEKRQNDSKLKSLFQDNQLNQITPDIALSNFEDVPDPLIHQYWSSKTLKAVSESFYEKLCKYAKSEFTSKERASMFINVMCLKYLRSLVSPGEEVGILTGQSIGEPSTQMTLNTFHLAGRGEVNITLGIPRLRELIQTSGSIKTPYMILSLYPNASYELAKKLADSFYCLTLYELFEDVKVQRLLTVENNVYVRSYDVEIKLIDGIETRWGLDFSTLKSKYRGFIATLVNYILKSWDMKSVFVGQITQGVKFDVLDSLGFSSQNELLEEEILDLPSKDDEDFDSIKYRNQKSESSYGTTPHSQDNPASPEEDEEENDDQPETTHNDDGSEPSSSPPDDQLSQSDMIKWHSVTANSIKFKLSVPATKPELLLASMIVSLTQNFVIRQVHGVQKAAVLKPDYNCETYRVQTAGINFEHARRLSNIIEVNSIQTNHISEVLKNYGIEAARETLRREIASVFKVYGITVDNRHLTLISDYMTHTGKIVPTTRSGMSLLNSPFLRMSYESVFSFLSKSVISGEYDNLKSPSSAITLGLEPSVGTNVFDVLQDLNFSHIKEQTSY